MDPELVEFFVMDGGEGGGLFHIPGTDRVSDFFLFRKTGAGKERY